MKQSSSRWSVEVLGLKLTWPILQATCSYYFRLVTWIAVLATVLFAMKQISNDTARALRAIFCYSFLLGLLVIVKIYAPGHYASMQWFCQPGNLFLRSWISLMFYVYLVPVPRDLAPVPAPQIVAWIFQCIFGNFLAVIIASSVMGFSLYLVRWWNRASVDTDDVQLLEEGEDRNASFSTTDGTEASYNSRLSISSSLGMGKVAAAGAGAGATSAGGGFGGASADRNFDDESGNGAVELQRVSQTGPCPDSPESHRDSVASISGGQCEGQQGRGLGQEKEKELRGARERKSSITVSRASDMFLAIDSLQSGFKGDFSPAALRAAAGVGGSRNTLSGRDMSMSMSSVGSGARGLGGDGGGGVGRVSISRMSTIKAEVRGKGSSAANTVAQNLAGGSAAGIAGGGDGGGGRLSYSYGNAERRTIGEVSRNMMVFNPALSAKTVPGTMRVISEASVESGDDRRTSVATTDAHAHTKPGREKETEDTNVSPALPIIPTMPQLANIWSFIAIATSIVTFFSPNKTQNAVISFQLSATVAIFLVCTTYRSRLIQSFHPYVQVALQSVVMFTPAVIFVVIFTSLPTYTSWEDCLQQYLTGSDAVADFGAGNYVSFLVDAAVVSLAFVSVDAFVTYFNLLPILVPAIWVSCALIVVQASILSLILRSPDEISRPLLTRTVTTPVAINIGELTDGSASIIASSTVINGVFSYRTVTFLMDKLGVTNPMTRGTAAAITGTLLGALAVDENGEKAAAGIAMAAFGMCTILYAVCFAITPFLDFVLDP